MHWLGAALLSGAGFGYAWAATPSLPIDAQAGDLIFREGTEAVSSAVMAVDGGAYTHVGMLVRKDDTWKVLHATPSEVAGRPDGVVLDSIDFYLDPQRARQWAVYGVEADASEREQAVKAALGMLGKPFRIADASGTYCTVLLWNAWRTAGVDLEVTFTPLNLHLLPGQYLLPSALLASPKVRLLDDPVVETVR